METPDHNPKLSNSENRVWLLCRFVAIGGVFGQCTPDGLGCQAYPMRGNWLGGAMVYGPNIGSIYLAAQRILPKLPAPPGPPPPPPPKPPPPPPPVTPPPAGCNVTANWTFTSLIAPPRLETNGFFEAADGKKSNTFMHAQLVCRSIWRE